MRIKVRHYRKVENSDQLFTRHNMKSLGVSPQAKGGMTVAWLMDEFNRVLAYGQAHCSDEDNFNRRLGREIAVGRAKARLR